MSELWYMNAESYGDEYMEFLNTMGELLAEGEEEEEE